MREPHLRIRPARTSDAAAILDLHVRARTTYYRGFLPADELREQNRRRTEDYARAIASAERVVRCADLDGHVAGFVMLGPCYVPDPDPLVGGELYQIHVDPGRFRQGIGTRLHDAAVGVWRDRGVSVGRLWAWEFNERAGQFYRRLGWRTDGSRRPDDPRIGQYRMIGYRLEVPPV
jgi:ribosomal protein S18 acetylase RimI-like enzyme